jgi:PAS domain S-box-containing protein
MIDDNKTREQLLIELSSLRQEIAQLRELYKEPKQAKGSLPESERKYRELADLLPETVVEFDENCNFTFVNLTGLETFGYTEQDIEAGLNVLQTIAPEDHDRAREAVQRVLQGEKSGGHEYIMLRRDGSRFPAFIHASLIARDSKVEGLRAIVVDVTERNRAEEALRESEARYRRLFDDAVVGVFQSTPDGKVIAVNGAYARMFGYASPDELISAVSDVASDLYADPTRRPAVVEMIKNAGQSLQVENAYKRKDGSAFVGNLHAWSVPDNRGDLILEGFIEDITDRKRSEEALKESEERYRSIFINSPLGIFQSAFEGGFTRVNPALARILGYKSPQDVIDSVSDIATQIFVNPQERADILQRMRENGGQIISENEYLRKDGRKWIGHLTMSIISDEKGTPHHLDGIVEDVTEKKAMEEKLDYTMEQLRTLSHRLLEIQETERRYIARELHDEIGQTLTALRINLKRTERSRTAEPTLAAMRESTTMVEELINQVRNLSIELRPSVLDDFGLTAALDWYVNWLSAKAGFKVIFHTDFTDERFSPLLELTCFRITQEALTNAARHSNTKNVYVDLEMLSGELHLTVRDDGKGFDVDKTHEQALKGKSFGLLGMHERATLAGGCLKLTSQPGKGTVVHAFFPLDSKMKAQ